MATNFKFKNQDIAQLGARCQGELLEDTRSTKIYSTYFDLSDTTGYSSTTYESPTKKYSFIPYANPDSSSTKILDGLWANRPAPFKSYYKTKSTDATELHQIAAWGTCPIPKRYGLANQDSIYTTQYDTSFSNSSTHTLQWKSSGVYLDNTLMTTAYCVVADLVARGGDGGKGVKNSKRCAGGGGGGAGGAASILIDVEKAANSAAGAKILFVTGSDGTLYVKRQINSNSPTTILTLSPGDKGGDIGSSTSTEEGGHGGRGGHATIGSAVTGVKILWTWDPDSWDSIEPDYRTNDNASNDPGGKDSTASGYNKKRGGNGGISLFDFWDSYFEEYVGRRGGDGFFFKERISFIPNQYGGDHSVLYYGGNGGAATEGPGSNDSYSAGGGGQGSFLGKGGSGRASTSSSITAAERGGGGGGAAAAYVDANKGNSATWENWGQGGSAGARFWYESTTAASYKPVTSPSPSQYNSGTGASHLDVMPAEGKYENSGGLPGGGGGCLFAGTQLYLDSESTINIEDFTAGSPIDFCLPDTWEHFPQQTLTTATYRNSTKKLTLILEDNKQISLTANHAILTDEGLKTYEPTINQFPLYTFGDRIATIDGYKELIAIQTEFVPPTTVYNIVTENSLMVANGIIIAGELNLGVEDIAIGGGIVDPGIGKKEFGNGCVTADTPILVAQPITAVSSNVYKTAENVFAGSPIIAYNTQTNEFISTRVTMKYSSEVQILYKIELSNQNTLTLSEKHGIYCENNIYKYCGDGDDSKYLQIGDLVLTETGFAKVESITRKDFVKPITVYNFLPAEGDAFLAGNIVVAAEDPDVPSTFVERPIFRRQIID